MRIFSRKNKEVRALKALFFMPDGSLKPEGKVVLTWLRDEVNGKGKRWSAGGSALFGDEGRFDAAKVAYCAGQRRVLDLIVSRLAIDDMVLLALVADEEKREQELAEELTTI